MPRHVARYEVCDFGNSTALTIYVMVFLGIPFFLVSIRTTELISAAVGRLYYRQLAQSR